MSQSPLPHFANKKVLITGGAGFLGSHLTAALAVQGAQITVFDNLTTGAAANLTAVAHQIDLQDCDALALDWGKIVAQGQFDYFFHLIGNANVPASVANPEMDFSLNLQLVFKILENLRKINWQGRFIFPSSAAVYGNPVRLPIAEDDWTIPISPYGVSKLAAERYIAIYHALYGLKTASLRLFSIYGPRQRKLVVYDITQKIRANPTEVLVYGDGQQMRDFLYVKDAITAMLMIAERGKFEGEIYNTASGQAQTILTLIEQISHTLGVKPRYKFSGAVRPGEPEKWSVDVGRLTQLGFVPAYSLAQGIAETIAWIEANK